MILLLAGCVRSHEFDIDVALVEEATAPAAPVEPFTWEVGLYDERSSAYLPAFLDVEHYGAAMLADSLRRPDDGFLSVTVEGLMVEVDAPLELTFTISSEGGRRWVASLAADVVAPAACGVTVDAATSAEAHAAEVLACLRAWADANGGPVDLYVEVAASTTDDDWSFGATYTFGADRPVIAACSGPQVVDDEIREQSQDVVFEELGLAGYAASLDQVMSAVAFANTWAAADALPGAGGWGAVRVDAGEGAFVGERIELAEDVPAEVVFRSGAERVTTFPADWAEVALEELSAADGFVDACIVQVPDALPNASWTHAALVGTGTVTR